MSVIGRFARAFAILGLFTFAHVPRAAAWTSPQNLSADADATAWPDVAVAHDGTLHVVWTDQTTREMKHSMRPLAGSWSAAVVVATYAGTTPYSDGDVAVAVAPDGTVHIVYADDVTGNSEIYHRSKPPAGAWSAAVNISQTAGTRSEFPDVAVSPDGTVHAAWIDVTPTGGICCSETYYASRPVGGAWAAAVNVSNSSANEYVIRIGVGPDNSAHILTAQEDGGPGLQNIYHYGRPAGGSFGSGDNLTTTANMGRNMGGVVQTADGTAHVVYYQGNPPEVMYMSRPACGSWSSPVNLSNDASASYNPDISADACGTVHVAWVDNAAGGQVLYSGLPVNGSWSAPINIAGSAPGGGRVQLASAGARDNLTGTVEALYQISPGGISDVFLTEAALTGCGAAPVVGVFDPGDRRDGSDAGRLRVIPNPAAGRVRFEAPAGGAPSSLRIFDMAGRLLRELELTPGAHGRSEADWDGCDARGRQAPTGVYWARAGLVEHEIATRVVLVR